MFSANSLYIKKEGQYYLNTNLYELLGDFSDRMIDTDVLGTAFEPEQPFENPDGTKVRFDRDYFGAHRGIRVVPGPFADAAAAKQEL